MKMRWIKNISPARRYMLLEVMSLIAFVLFMTLVRGGSARDVPMDLIAARMDEIPYLQTLLPGDENAIQSSFGLNSSKYSESYYRYAESGLDVHMLLLLKCKDTASRQQAQEDLREYLNEKTVLFRDYGTEQYALLKQAVLRGRGIYCIFFFFLYAAEWEEVLLSLIR